MPNLIPSILDLCHPMTLSPGPQCITFPGGAELCAQMGFETGDLTEITKSLLGQVNAAMMPLIPAFDLMDVALSVLECIKAIPDSLGPPPDPSKILKCIPKLKEAVDKVLKLIPIVSIPALAKSLIEVLITALLGVKLNLLAMLKRQTSLIDAANNANQLGNLTFKTAVDCAQQNLDIQVQNIGAGMLPLNRLISLLNFFLAIVAQNAFRCSDKLARSMPK
jgi:hypothetical protein